MILYIKFEVRHSMSLDKNYEFLDIIHDIIYHEKFKQLDLELHHGISRYGHSMRVAKYTYKIAKFMNWDYESITRAALLHDFFFDVQLENYGKAKTWCKHPEVAIINSKKYFELNDLQENIIVSHMFPSCKILPKYKESWLVTCVDKCVSFYEMYRFKASLVLGIWTIFLFNMLTLQK